jgi:hypothetical protein
MVTKKVEALADAQTAGAAALARGRTLKVASKHMMAPTKDTPNNSCYDFAVSRGLIV